MITYKYDSLFSYWTFFLTLFNLLSFFFLTFAEENNDPHILSFWKSTVFFPRKLFIYSV